MNTNINPRGTGGHLSGSVALAGELTTKLPEGRFAILTMPRLRSKLARVAALIAMLLTAQVLAAPAASAYTWTNTGSTGGVTAYQVIGTHFPVPCGYGYSGCFQPGVILNGPLVSRSPGSTGAQTVVVNYNVFRYSGGWYLESSEPIYQTIPAGYSLTRFPSRSWLLNTGGPKYVQYVVAWVDQRTNTALGARVISMNQQGDYTCQTRFTSKCWVGPGYVAVNQPS